MRGRRALAVGEATCQVCDAAALEEIVGFQKLARISSDCKPWPAGGQLFICTACAMVQKQTSPAWRQEIAQIYDDYALYPQGQGAEQSVFDDLGEATASRSEAIITHLADVTPLADSGRLLDIGCGNGAFLSAFAKMRKGWQLHGSELDTRNLAALQAIPGFEKLHSGALPDIDETFNLISIIHALEHIEHPHQFLAQVAKNLMTPDSVMMIELPDWRSNPFDLLIADHLLHFDMASLQTLLDRCGLSTLSLANDRIAKEISLIARLPDGEQEKQGRHLNDPQILRQELENALAWLQQLVGQAKALCDQSDASIGIFGSSIAASWLYGAIDSPVDFFVDEDLNRVGCELFERPILAPDEVPADADIFIPLGRETAQRIAHRLNRESGPRYMVPEL